MDFWKRLKGGSARPVFVGPNHETPEAFIQSFCVDYRTWNDHCMAAPQPDDPVGKRVAMDRFSKLYRDVTERYTGPDARLQSITFGTEATFDPDRLRFGDPQIDGDRIKQPFSIASRMGSFADDYFADILQQSAGTLRLLQIHYIDPFPEDYAPGVEPILPCL